MIVISASCLSNAIKVYHGVGDSRGSLVVIGTMVLVALLVFFSSLSVEEAMFCGLEGFFSPTIRIN